MTTEEREELSRRLDERERQILHTTHEQVEDATQAPEVRTDVLDSVDEAVDDVAKTAQLELGERDRQLLVLIREAKARMADGTYGRCVDCDEEIEVGRLMAVPWAARCEDDQERLEQEKRLHPPTI